MNMRIDGSSSSIPTPTTPSFPNAGQTFGFLTPIDQAITLYNNMRYPPAQADIDKLMNIVDNIPNLCSQAMASVGVTNYDPANPPSDPVVNQFCQVLTALSANATTAAPLLSNVLEQESRGGNAPPMEKTFLDNAWNPITDEIKAAEKLVNDSTNG